MFIELDAENDHKLSLESNQLLQVNWGQISAVNWNHVYRYALRRTAPRKKDGQYVELSVPRDSTINRLQAAWQMKHEAGQDSQTDLQESPEETFPECPFDENGQFIDDEGFVVPMHDDEEIFGDASSTFPKWC